MIKKKSFSLQTQSENRVGRWAKFLEWNRKWNKIMAGIFCVLVFALLFGAVMVNTTTTTTSSKQSKTRNGNIGDSVQPQSSCEFFATNKITGNMCDILCTCTQPEFLSFDVEAAIANDDTECRSLGYHLRYAEPQVTAISPGWLKTNATISKITITDVGQRGVVMEIEPGAFNDCPFRKMTELVIRQTIISVLRLGIFEGASSLKKISFVESNLQMIEESTMDPLYQLEEIKMIKMIKMPRFENLLDLTGYPQLKHVRLLNLSSNSFASSIDAETFKGCINVESIDLSNSLIETIGIGTFDHLAATIQFLDLRNNKLKHLPSKSLEPLLRPNVQIYLSQNLWQCDCESLELQAWAAHNSGAIVDSVICNMPPLANGTDITVVELGSCDEETEEPHDTTTEGYISNPPTTSMQPPFSEPLTCVSEKNISDTLYLGKVYQYFNVKQIEMGTVLVEIVSSDSSLSMVVINDQDDAECKYNINRQMVFNNLNPNAAHLFCLIKKTSDATSPRNCYPFRFDDSKSIWGHDEIIIALICSIVLSLVVGVLCGWLLSCRYRRVFKAKTPLQYRTSERSTSKTMTEIEDFNSSITSDYFTGRYGSVKASNPTRLRRTYSDNSIASGESYITAVAPSPFEIIQWKLRKNATQANNLYLRDYVDKLEYDCLPPPLPPHPNRRSSDKIYETIAGEPVYNICTSDIDPYKITYVNK